MYKTPCLKKASGWLGRGLERNPSKEPLEGILQMQRGRGRQKLSGILVQVGPTVKSNCKVYIKAFGLCYLPIPKRQHLYLAIGTKQYRSIVHSDSVTALQ